MYTPKSLPFAADAKGVASYVQQELQSVSKAFSAPVDYLQLNPLPAAPNRPRQGMVAYANGVNWNPGSGAGPYHFNGTAWVAMF